MTEPVKSKINIMPEGNKGTALNVTKPCYLVNDPSHEVKFIYSNRKQYLFESKMNSELYTFDVKDIDKFVFNKPETQSLLDAFCPFLQQGSSILQSLGNTKPNLFCFCRRFAE